MRIEVKEKYFRMAENCLKSYNLVKAHIDNLEEDLKLIELEDGISCIDYSREKNSETYKISKSTEETAVKNITSKDLIKKQIELYASKLEKIDKALENLGQIERNILIDYYINGRQWYEIAFDYKFSERHCKRKRNNAICSLALILYGKMSLLCPEFLDAI